MYLSRSALLALISITIALPTNSPKQASQGQLLIADTGLGHHSSPIGRWPTSIRRINTDGTNATTLQQFGHVASEEPIIAYSFAYDSTRGHLFIATGAGIIRTEVDGSNPVTVFNEADPKNWLTTIAVSNKKLYWGSGYEGFIKRANLDGSNVEVLRNVSLGVKDYGGGYTPANSYANGLIIDEKNQLIYWSQNGGSICRAPLSSSSNAGIEVLINTILSPGQLRLLSNASTLYFVDTGRYFGDVSALKRAQLPTKIETPGAVPTEILAQETVNENGGGRWLYGFAIDEATERLWYGGYYAYRYADAEIVEIGLGGGVGKVVNRNVTDIGFPVGLEYIV